MEINTPQDLNKGMSQTAIITPQGEMVDNYTGSAWAGANFEKDLDTTEIAKRIRKKIKETGWTSKNGFKISVTSKYFSGGSSIDITIKELPFEVYTNDTECGDWTNQTKFIVSSLKKLMTSYRYQDFDGMIDYFCTNFYGRVSLDCRL